ncbi:hypothetical protein BDV95DRAFT_138986 [Massariosphaeria phaeospora]|uniref:Uncharacterized protein n=1 Tax=Massariosphaeria phaeospora TaxID=100035 RepID=A0A7C8MIE1_9PLEO|nr:hypothetical protein BDV95DRAFT_138986 [Massariosphaeria phaeospora]
MVARRTACNTKPSVQGEYGIVAGKNKVLSSDMLLLRFTSCDLGSHPFKLSCGHRLFEQIRKAFKLHATSEEVILNNNGAFARHFFKSRNTLAIVLKVPNSVNFGYDALSMVFDGTRRSTRAFFHGQLGDEYERLVSSFQSQKDRSFFTQPMLLPTRLLLNHRLNTERYRSKIDHTLHSTEREIGYAIPGLLQYNPSRDADAESKPDFERIVRQLHSCQTELSQIPYQGQFGYDFGVFLGKTALEVKDWGFLPPNDAHDYSEGLVHRIEFATNLYSTILMQSSILKSRVQNHINLTFSLIAQDENKISRSIAQESALIAAASKRDSAAMKTISVLTMVFLPPTFVATFFSMTMFDWTPPSPPPSPSPSTSPNPGVTYTYLWVYWAVALPLTALVLIVWRVWWSIADRRYQHEMRKENPEKKKRGKRAKSPERPAGSADGEDEEHWAVGNRTAHREWAFPLFRRGKSFERERGEEEQGDV